MINNKQAYKIEHTNTEHTYIECFENEFIV
jgi:hypothetical protein